MNEPLVSILIINYNCAKYVLETLHSIAGQTYQNTELVIIDDFSTDNSASIIEDWLITYNKPCQFIRHKENLGVVKTINEAVRSSKGKYISFIATDDLYLPEKTSIQVNLLESSADDICAVYSDGYLINEDSSPRYGWFIQRQHSFAEVPSGNIYNELLTTNWIPGMSLLMKKSCITEAGYFDENLKYEDYDMWLRLAKKYKFLFSDFVSCKYRIRNSSMSFNVNWDCENLKIYCKHLDNATAVKRFEESVYKCYLSGQSTVIKSLAPFKKINKAASAALSLHKLKVPTSVGKRILTRFFTS